MSNYFRCKWITDNENYPIQIISEIDDDRYETRKIEVYSSGNLGYAYDDVEYNGTALGDVPVPEFSKINSDPQFELQEISKEEFEILWSNL